MANQTSEQTSEFRHDMGPLIDEAYALVAATKDVSGNNIQDIRKRFTDTLATAKAAYGRVRRKTLEGTKYADEYVHQNPYRGIGVCIGGGANWFTHGSP